MQFPDMNKNVTPHNMNCDGGCGLVFKTLGALDTHRLTCPNISKKKGNSLSFFTSWTGGAAKSTKTTTETDNDKTLPLTQPSQSNETKVRDRESVAIAPKTIPAISVRNCTKTKRAMNHTTEAAQATQ